MLAGLLGAVPIIGDVLAGLTGGNQPPTQPVPPPQPAYIPPPPQQKDNTGLFVGIGAAVLALIVLVISLTKK